MLYLDDIQHNPSMTSPGLPWLDSVQLNKAQKEAVLHTSGPLLLFAGAGSGKTRVLTYRFANLIREKKARAQQILAVTFTNKAANEMKSRIAQLTSSSVNGAWVSTFHSACARILRAHARVLDFTPGFAIYDTTDCLSLCKRVFKSMGINPREFEPQTAIHLIDRAKNDYIYPDDFAAHYPQRQKLEYLMVEVYKRYQDELQRANAMDFGDLLCHTLSLLKLNDSVLDYYRELFAYIMVDEYQDTNKVQYMLIKLLAQEHKNLCVVGDDDQSIYAFRGATSQNLLSFKKDFPDAHEIFLDTNYRSSRNIIELANSIISNNSQRKKKSMRTDNAPGAFIVGRKAFSERDEAENVVRHIIKLREEGIPYKDMAVFYRINAISRAIEDALNSNSIPYVIYGSHKFYDRKEIKDIMAYFRILLNPQDNEAFLRIINTPARGLGETSVGALMAFADSKRLPLSEALIEALKTSASFLSPSNKKRFGEFASMIRELREEALTAEKELLDESIPIDSKAVLLPKLLRRIAERSDYLPRLTADDSPENAGRVENILELFNVAAEFARLSLRDAGSFTLADFVERTSLSTDVEAKDDLAKKEPGEKENSPGMVSLMSLHLAKGLEFDVVFLIGLEDGILPHSRSIYDKKELEEERRLLYVGVTRAKKQLFLSRAEYRQNFSQRSCTGGGSRFISEFPRELLQDESWGFLDDY